MSLCIDIFDWILVLGINHGLHKVVPGVLVLLRRLYLMKCRALRVVRCATAGTISTWMLGLHILLQGVVVNGTAEFGSRSLSGPAISFQIQFN